MANQQKKSVPVEIIVLLIVTVVLSFAIVFSSFQLLPDAPLYPTPTQPKAIDFPDARPVPR